LTRSLSILEKSSAIPPEDCGFSSFASIEAEDAALFMGSTGAVGGTTQDTMRFIEIDRSKQSTVSKMGFKDGQDAVAYLGFRNKGGSECIFFCQGLHCMLTLTCSFFKGKFSHPEVMIPSLVEEEEEEEDPDAIPPPLDDEDEIMRSR
jgi:hypothetical protein